jgi:hypothetical protein
MPALQKNNYLPYLLRGNNENMLKEEKVKYTYPKPLRKTMIMIKKFVYLFC